MKNGIGRPRKTYLEDIKEKMGFDSYIKVKRTAEIVDNGRIRKALPL